MSVQILRIDTEVERIPEVEAAIRDLFDAVDEATPAGVDYTAVRVADAAEFFLTLRLDDRETNPLLDIPEALAFRTKVAQWAGAPVAPRPVTVLGRYPR